MIDALCLATRPPRAPQGKPAAQQDDQTHQLAAAKAAFDMETEIQAEAEREREALEALLLAQLKDADEVMKKWIAMIG
jgi:hypothetical protein